MVGASLSRTVVVFRGPLLARPFVRWCVIAAAAFLAGAWIAILAIPSTGADASIVVHYTTTFGIDALGSWRDLLRLPLTGTVLLVVNCGLAWFLAAQHEREADSAQPVAPSALPHAPVVLMVASALLEFAVLVGALLLLVANSNR